MECDGELEMNNLIPEPVPSTISPLAVIVEDDRDIVDLFREVLEIAGYRTEIILDGMEALEKISALQPDLVLLDLQLPRMSGIDILENMRTSPAMVHIPVVVITAYSHSLKNLTIEPDLLLQKPVDINKLIKIVQGLRSAIAEGGSAALDPVTGLHSMPFFQVQLTFLLERIKQSMVKRFGILFADVIHWDDISGQMTGQELDDFQRRLANQFKSSLRLATPMAWSVDDGYFLTLIEDVSSEKIPLKMARKIGNDMRKYGGRYNSGLSLYVNLGVLVCDVGYVDALKIMKDLDLARDLLRNKQFSSPAIFDREMLYASK
jgi:CheY-like chemotaxis protein